MTNIYQLLNLEDYENMIWVEMREEDIFRGRIRGTVFEDDVYAICDKDLYSMFSTHKKMSFRDLFEDKKHNFNIILTEVRPIDEIKKRLYVLPAQYESLQPHGSYNGLFWQLFPTPGEIIDQLKYDPEKNFKPELGEYPIYVVHNTFPALLKKIIKDGRL